MATTFVPSAGDAIKPYGKCQIKHYPEDASQTFKRGYPVILGGAGVENKIKVSGTDPVAALVGIAAADASGVTGAMCPVWLAKPELKFVGRTIAGTTVDFTAIGSCVALEAHASLAIWVVDISDAGHDAVVVEHFINPDTQAYQTVEGDSEANVVFHFDPKATIFGAGT